METTFPASVVRYLHPILLPIREAYEWKLHDFPRVKELDCLLPIREAYEWKQRRRPRPDNSQSTCFQFVKRMNGNSVSFGSGRVARPCFQFVKRMNGNNV